jgi:hypothetical protein
MGSEPVHVAAHLILYGTLALQLRAALGARPVIVFTAVIAFGVAQETAQVFHARSFGGPEIFDLCVDAVATAIALGAWHLRTRRRRSVESRPEMNDGELERTEGCRSHGEEHAPRREVRRRDGG